MFESPLLILIYEIFCIEVEMLEIICVLNLLRNQRSVTKTLSKDFLFLASSNFFSPCCYFVTCSERIYFCMARVGCCFLLQADNIVGCTGIEHIALISLAFLYVDGHKCFFSLSEVVLTCLSVLGQD